MLYGRLGLKGGRKGKSGQYSTDVTELERLAAEGIDCARLVLDWRQLTKLKSTYTDALQAQINPETGRVHTSFSPDGSADRPAVVERPQSAEHPDPHRDRPEDPRRLRRRSGHKLLSADYSQIELRLAAHMADVPQLKEAFRAARTSTQSPPRSCSAPSTATRATRRRRSISRSSTAFRRGGWRAGSACRKDEGKAIIDRYFERFPGHPRVHPRTLGFAREHGFTRTLFGRKTHFEPNIRSPNPSIRGGAERAAINAPIQGTSADLIKRAMARMDGALADAGLEGVQMLLQVHDELVFEVPDGREEEAAAVIKQVMAKAAEPALQLDVPLDVEVGWGPHWGEAH